MFGDGWEKKQDQTFGRQKSQPPPSTNKQGGEGWTQRVSYCIVSFRCKLFGTKPSSSRGGLAFLGVWPFRVSPWFEPGETDFFATDSVFLRDDKWVS